MLVVVHRRDRARVKRALVGFAGHQSRAVVPTLERAAFGVQAQPALRFFPSMTADAVQFEDRFDLLLEFHFVGGPRGRKGARQKSGGEQEVGSVHWILRWYRYC